MMGGPGRAETGQYLATPTRSDRTEITNGKGRPMAEHAGQAEAPAATSSLTTAPAVAAAPEPPGGADAGRAADAAAAEALRDGEEYALRSALLFDEIYHCDRAAFLKRVDRLGSFVTALMGTAAVGGAVGQVPVVGVVAGALVAFIETGKLVIDFAGEARKHEVKVERLKALRSAFASSGKSLAEIREMEARRHALEPVEAGVFHAVSALAWNATYLALSSSQDRNELLIVHPWDARLRHVRRFTAERFLTRAETRAAESRVPDARQQANVACVDQAVDR